MKQSTKQPVLHLHLLCRCGDISTYQVLPDDATSQEEEKEEIRKYLTLDLSPGEDVTVECVTNNSMGESRGVFNPRKCQTVNTDD